ncbi:MAG TPA: TetR/AcrR family transcriptional regulator [Acidimicrobiales bacterium]|nr:TetR/AcrR family transcriptional regulator [Acidimicrobiales bacterium]
MKLLREEGWDAVTQARVAAASGVGRATVYRYWSDRTQLIRDAVVASLVVTPHILPTGEFRADLIDELRYLRHYLTENDLAPVLAALVDRAEWEPDLMQVKCDLVDQGMSMVHSLVARAVADGTLRPDVDPNASVSVLAGPLLFRRLLSNEPTDDAFLAWLVDSYLESHRFKSRLRPARPSNT